MKSQTEIVKEYEKHKTEFLFEAAIDKLRARKPILAARIYNARVETIRENSTIVDYWKNRCLLAESKYLLTVSRYINLIKLLSKKPLSDEMIKDINKKINETDEFEDKE